MVRKILVLIISFLGTTALFAAEEKTKLAPYTGLKKRIAVAAFEEKVPHRWWVEDWKVGTGMSDMLATALVNTGRFIVVERERLQDVIKEQDLVASGRISKETGAKTGRIIGAQIMVYGAVTEFEAGERGGGFAFGYKGIGIGVGGKKAHVGIDLKVYDTTTSQVLASKRAVGNASSSGFTLGGYKSGVPFGIGSFHKTPIGKACREAIEEAVNFICARMEKVPWQGRVVLVKGKKVYINAGGNSNVRSEDEFVVYKSGEELIDPETGLNLGTETTRIGQIKVTAAQDKFSICDVVRGKGFGRGDIIRAIK